MSIFRSWSRIALGNEGERQALNFLKKQGYRLVEKNYRCVLGEIDLLMSKQQTLVVVEVKSGSNRNIGAKFHFNYAKKKKLIRLAEFFIHQHVKYKSYTVRFDLVVYQPNDEQAITHYPYVIDDVESL